MSNGASRQLPPPVVAGEASVEDAIVARRSYREFEATPLSLEQIGQLCWAAQGITHPGLRLRASPSAGGLYPIELYVVTRDGVELYKPEQHLLEGHRTGDLRSALQRAAVDQEAIGESPVCLVITAVVARAARKYGGRAERYCFLEAGHVAQNVLLQAEALLLAGVPIGAFDDEAVARVLGLPEDCGVLYLLPIGHPRST